MVRVCVRGVLMRRLRWVSFSVLGSRRWVLTITLMTVSDLRAHLMTWCYMVRKYLGFLTAAVRCLSLVKPLVKMVKVSLRWLGKRWHKMVRFMFVAPVTVSNGVWQFRLVKM